MFKLAFGVLILSTILAAGCNNGAPAPVLGSSPKKLNPGLVLKWPGTPEEEDQSTALGDKGELKSYSAKLVKKEPGGVVIFHAYVDEYPDAALKENSIKELMSAKVFAFSKDDVSRKEITHGPTKYPGLEILRRSNGLSTRMVLVAASSRLYHLTATTKNEVLLEGEDVKEFLDSLKVSE